MKRRTYVLTTWLTGVLVLLGLMAWGTAVSRADEQETGEQRLFLPLILNPNTAPDWLQYLNQFRQLADLPLVTEEATWSAGGVLHSKYMVRNDRITHSEDVSNKWYTPEGAAAGQNGNVAVFSLLSATDEMAIDLWMTGPFHAVGILDPALQRTGFGSYHEDIGLWKTGATLDVLRGIEPIPGSISFPIYFPQDGSDFWLTSYDGNESPDPLTSCPGYSAPSGPPIILQLGGGAYSNNDVTPNVTDSSFQSNGVDLEHCVFDETSYVGADPGVQSTGRSVLNARDAVVIMPKYPLAVGETYTASVTHDSSVYAWSFTIISGNVVSPNQMGPGSFDYEIR